jgi:flavin reductase (DIM6/NTAB) family NADH-FMN oxidoreductase RutF
VSIPSANMGNELTFCGTKSGRDYDKFKECKLAVVAAQRVVSPIIKTPGLHYECKIVYKTAMRPDFLDKELDQNVYPLKDYHTLYFGEIVDCYELE